MTEGDAKSCKEAISLKDTAVSLRLENFVTVIGMYLNKCWNIITHQQQV